MFTQPRKRGQALVLIVFAIIGLIAIVALAIDGGNVFLNRRRAQNAADTAVVAGALKIAGGGNSSAELSAAKAAALSAAKAIATSNGYTDGDGSGVTTVTVYTMDTTAPANAGCSSTALSDPRDLAHPTVPPDLLSNYIVVTIKSATKTYFAPIVGINQLSYCVFAISHAVRGTTGIPFYGNSIVALDPTPGDNGFDSGNSEAAHWVVKRGGIFSNSNAYSKNASSVTFEEGACVTTVGTESGFSGCTVAQNQTALKYNYPADIIPLLPPIPPCTGTALYSNSDHLVHEQVGFEGMGSKLTGQDLITGSHPAYAPGVYCITDAGGNLTNDIITGTGVTFYIKSVSYQLSLSGHGYIGASAPTTGTYKGLLMFSGITPSNWITPYICTQTIDILGNGGTPIVGSIFLPSACIYYGGNGVGDLTDSMMVGYRISSNGTGDLYVSYNSDHNYHPVISPTVELTK